MGDGFVIDNSPSERCGYQFRKSFSFLMFIQECADIFMAVVVGSFEACQIRVEIRICPTIKKKVNTIYLSMFNRCIKGCFAITAELIDAFAPL